MMTKRKLKLPFMLKVMRFNIHLLTLISPPLAARVVNHLWFKTCRVAEPRREQNHLETAEWKTINVEQNKIQLYIWGQHNEPTILLVHGWNGRAAQLGLFAQDLVEQGYRVISFDAPGHGRTSANSTNLPEISRVIQKLSHEYGPFKAGISHSFGGLCLLHAVREGIEMHKIICIASASNAERLVEVFAAILQIQPRIIDLHKKLLEQQFGEEMWKRFSMPEMVKEITIPGLIIHDEDDMDVPMKSSKLIAQEWPNSELVITAGLGHRRILRDKIVIRRVTSFIGDKE
ncbi:MAG: hypothetical protein DRQ46_03505 [Gammaproteobacteria bacterium]|nr:MAG: hypothetical protein DRQ46_03505 [Gammaproteobacteria bacterium]